jgi:23S rRNA (uracil1939-C5)-methyltransferase
MPSASYQRGIVDEILELTIQDLSRGGAGVGRDASGRAIFVHGTAPGDRVRARVTEEKKRYAQAELVEVLERSPQRVEPRCSVFGPGAGRCGGCQWQHLPYDLQWKTKVEGALHALSRVGFEAPSELPREEFPAKNPWGYRNRIQLRGGAHGVGFYARGSHEVVPISRCEIAREELNDALPGLAAEARALPAPSKVEVDVDASGGVRTAWNARHAALGFRQVNDEQNEALRGWIGAQLMPSPEGLLLDLYGGAGNLSLGLTSRFGRIQCVDTGAPREAPEGAPSNFEFHARDVGRWVERELKSGAPGAPVGGAVILDPPREGCGEAIEGIARLAEARGLRQWIAVGCDPDAWAKDLWRLLKSERGSSWRLERFAFFDFFPQTVHLESVALLTRV